MFPAIERQTKAKRYAQDPASRLGIFGTALEGAGGKDAATSIDRPVVLIVDDQPGFAETLGELLHELGCDAVPLESPRQALEVASHRRFDLVILDIRMPEMSGIELLKLLKPIGHGRIYMATAHADAAMIADAMQGGADGFFFKPLNLAELQQLIHEARAARSAVEKSRDAGPETPAA
jgi:DNA-binding NtrC family response regulator